MKKNILLFVASIVLVTTALASPAGKTMGEQIDVIITTKNQKAEQTRPKAPAYRPFDVCVDTDCGIICVIALRNLGDVSAIIENITTGEQYNYCFDSSNEAFLPLCCSAGFWQITLILGSGAEYVGEFQL